MRARRETLALLHDLWLPPCDVACRSENIELGYIIMLCRAVFLDKVTLQARTNEDTKPSSLIFGS